MSFLLVLGGKCKINSQGKSRNVAMCEQAVQLSLGGLSVVSPELVLLSWEQGAGPISFPPSCGTHTQEAMQEGPEPLDK